jgi:hypothetical protein
MPYRQHALYYISRYYILYEYYIFSWYYIARYYSIYSRFCPLGGLLIISIIIGILYELIGVFTLLVKLSLYRLAISLIGLSIYRFTLGYL